MIYLRHFGLREAPFSITPDPSFFYAHEGAQAALNTLLVALRSGEGFLKIVGEVGCGKTVLCRRLLHELRHDCVTAYVPNPDLGPRDLLLALAVELGLSLPASASRHRLQSGLQRCLLEHAALGRRVVVLIDEAQAMPIRTIESLRLLSNLETEKRKLLQMVLFGQPEIDARLARAEVRQLLQRISFSEYLGPMPPVHVPAYLRHRVRVAAHDAQAVPELFDIQARQAIAHASAGIPRVINLLAHKGLLLAFGEDRMQVTAGHVKLAAADTGGAAVDQTWWSRLFGGRARHAGGSTGAVAGSRWGLRKTEKGS